jgi:SAM-dependent methyltransferase
MRYAHTNVVARDWRALASFYESVFACERVLPERELSGAWLARSTGVVDAALQGVHLRLPGSSATLEVFQYEAGIDRPPPMANERGYGHLAFEVDDVAHCLDRVLAAGGAQLGEVVTRAIAGAGEITFVYARDPEGNVLELQQWHTREVGVAAGYAQWAGIYDEDTNPTRDADATVVRRWLPALGGLDVLELGCGTGKNTAALAAARSVTAFDLSEHMMAHARVRAPFAQFVRHDITQVPWPVRDATADVLLCNLVLEHIADLTPIFAELARVLRPGGRALVVEFHPFRQLGGKQARFVDPSTSEVLRVSAHAHSVSEYIATAGEAGLALAHLHELGDGGVPTPPGEIPRLLSMGFTRPWQCGTTPDTRGRREWRTRRTRSR